MGKRGLERLGVKEWSRCVVDVATRLREALQMDYVVLGGGHAKRLEELPEGARLGDNAHAFRGGFRLWGLEAG